MRRSRCSCRPARTRTPSQPPLPTPPSCARPTSCSRSDSASKRRWTASSTAHAQGVDIVELAPQLEPIPFALEELHDDEDDHDDQPHGDEDPHVWFDPVRMADGVQLLGEELERRLGPGAWQERAADYRNDLLAVHEQIETVTAAVTPDRRVLVTNHESIGYFAHRYDFELAGTIIPGGTTDATPSSAAFAELARLVEDRELPAIIAENTANDTLAQALARESAATSRWSRCTPTRSERRGRAPRPTSICCAPTPA